MKIVIYNIGCKVNQCECDSLASTLRKSGHTVVNELEAADSYIINTCAVTQEAEKKSRQCVARVKKYNPDADIYVIGCASEKNMEQFTLKGVKYVAGTAHKELVATLCESNAKHDLPTKYENLDYGQTERARSFVKVQDGCNNFCSYCIVPYLRGRSRSRELGDIIVECNMRSLDTDEIVLAGINLSAYGKDIGLNLTDLVKATANISARIRLGSLEINAITVNLLQAVKDSGNICPHFHLSLQSGDDGVLKSMNRHYTREEFIKKVKKIRKFFPESAITTDIIVGFPTEDEEAFEATLDFVKQVGFSDIHIFPYSRRAGTAAFPLGALNDEVVKTRIERLAALRDTLKREYLTMFIERELDVIAEYADDRFIEGYSENYIRVYIPHNSTAQLGKLYKVRADNLHKDGLIARKKY
ncbi:MAG: tRNA (N(6)-L-threonylcarbamoyladenosine(37)-C(2))-methylthiotransferase MtaB [Clostridia bacterium]|nr:tRNA (N(6)-L-threonylcarbamoyladenosine(37)-C(2))-methylthiotransferase MtaB [Clostridia bacterium]